MRHLRQSYYHVSADVLWGGSGSRGADASGGTPKEGNDLLALGFNITMREIAGTVCHDTRF